MPARSIAQRPALLFYSRVGQTFRALPERARYAVPPEMSRKDPSTPRLVWRESKRMPPFPQRLWFATLRRPDTLPGLVLPPPPCARRASIERSAPRTAFHASVACGRGRLLD